MKGRVVPLILSFVLGALAAPLAAEAQEAGKVFRVGWLDPFDVAAEVQAPFVRELRELGYIEGRNLRIEVRKADWKPERLPELAAALAKLNVDLIVAYGDPAILAARRATSTIPIVMVGSSDPVGAGFVASPGRPGGNVTGVTDAAAEIAAKQLELLREVNPRISRVTVLLPPPLSGSEQVLKQTRAAAQALGVTLVFMEVWVRKDVERAFAAVTRDRTNALIVLSRRWIDTPSINLIAQLARKQRLPVMSDSILLTYAGGLMSSATSYAPQARRAAQYADKILRGSRPADLPVEQPTEFELTLNLEPARALGLTIPPSVRLRANTVLE